MKKVLVVILAVMVNIITLPFQALSLIGLKKRIKKADENLEDELEIVDEMCEERTLNYDQFSELRKILAKHYETILEGPTKIFVKWSDWVGNYVPLVKEYMTEIYRKLIMELVVGELIDTVSVGY